MKFAVLVVIFAFGLSACGDSSNGPVSLNGTWTSDSPSMTAHISNNQIEIDMTDGDVSALYWKGTLSSSVNDGESLKSIGDTDAMDSSLMGSQDSNKQFVYKDGKLRFSFSILGTTQKVELEK